MSTTPDPLHEIIARCQNLRDRWSTQFDAVMNGGDVSPDAELLNDVIDHIRRTADLTPKPGDLYVQPGHENEIMRVLSVSTRIVLCWHDHYDPEAPMGSMRRARVEASPEGFAKYVPYRPENR